MAGTTTKSTQISYPGSTLKDVVINHNAVIVDLEALRAALNTLATNFNAVLTKLDADAGVTDTNFNALQAVVRTTYDAAGDLLAAKVGDATGTAITS